MKLSRYLIASFLAFTLLLTSCGSFVSELRGEIESQLGMDSDYDDDYYDDDYYDDDSYDSTTYDSSVGSLNEYSDLINDVYDTMDYLEYDLFYYTEYIEYYDPGVYEPSFSCLFELYSYDWLIVSTANPSYELTEIERQDLIAQATAIFASAESTKETCRALDRYVSSQDYKDDAFAQSAVLVSQLYADMDAYYTLHDQMVDTLETLYDIYENWVVNPSDPTSVGIGNMKEDMDVAEAIIDIVADAYLTENFNQTAALETLYNELAALTEAHSPDPGIYDAYVLDWYNYFYSDLEDKFLPATKRSLRALQSGNLNDLELAYWDITDHYDFIIDDYNTYLETAGY
ncbi:MAG: hypothetical protein ACI9QC_000078 [Oceanicoccus sp.]|jgi:hypothetical protein